MTDILSRDTFKAGLIAEGAVTVPTPSADTDAATKVYVDGKTLPAGGTPGQVLAKTGDTNYATGWMSTADLAAGTAPTVVRMGSMDCTYGSGTGSWVSSGGLLQGQAGDLVIVCMFQWTGTTYTPTSSGLTFTSRLTQAQVSGASWLDRQFQMWSTTLPDATARELTMSRNAGGAGGVTVIHIRGTDGTYATDTAVTAAANVVATTPKTITGYNGVSSRLIAFDLLLLDANSQADPVPATETTAGLWTSEISHTWDVNRNATWLGVNISTFSNAVPAATVALAVGATSVSYKFALAWNAPAASPPLTQATADPLYVNVTGDTMTGTLYTEDTTVYGQLTVFESSSFSSDLVVDGTLQVNTGPIKLATGYVAGHVLTSDASGNGTWQAPTGGGGGGGLDQATADTRYVNVTGDTVTGDLTLAVTGTDGRFFIFGRDGLPQWMFGNSGGNLIAGRYDDTGEWIDNPWSMNRADGVMVVDKPLWLGDSTPYEGNHAASKQYVDTRTPKITAATTAPSSPAVNDIWVDTN